jgi:pimeloyl-ACP methyl ester carboxylesterase
MTNGSSTRDVRAHPASLRSASFADADYGRGDQPDWRSVHWPSHLRAMTVDARRVHLLDIGTGTGAPIVLLHGLGGRWQNWLENIPRLAQHRRVVAIDLPGFGRSQMPVEQISIAGYARTVERVCDLLELQMPQIVGNSMGGLVALEFALRHPTLASGLVLVDAACIALNGRNPFRARAALTAFRQAAALLPHGVSTALTRPRARHLAFAGVVRHPTRIAIDMLYELSGEGHANGSPDALAALTRYDVRGELAQIELPTLVVHGRDDVLIPLADGAALAASIPGAELLVFDDTGHMPMVERPIAFNDALLHFVGAPSR